MYKCQPICTYTNKGLRRDSLGILVDREPINRRRWGESFCKGSKIEGGGVERVVATNRINYRIAREPRGPNHKNLYRPHFLIALSPHKEDTLSQELANISMHRKIENVDYAI
jgi:hypothetical protein